MKKDDERFVFEYQIGMGFLFFLSWLIYGHVWITYLLCILMLSGIIMSFYNFSIMIFEISKMH